MGIQNFTRHTNTQLSTWQVVAGLSRKIYTMHALKSYLEHMFPEILSALYCAVRYATKSCSFKLYIATLQQRVCFYRIGHEKTFHMCHETIVFVSRFIFIRDILYQ